MACPQHALRVIVHQPGIPHAALVTTVLPRQRFSRQRWVLGVCDCCVAGKQVKRSVCEKRGRHSKVDRLSKWAVQGGLGQPEEA